MTVITVYPLSGYELDYEPEAVAVALQMHIIPLMRDIATMWIFRWLQIALCIMVASILVALEHIPQQLTLIHRNLVMRINGIRLTNKH